MTQEKYVIDIGDFDGDSDEDIRFGPYSNRSSSSFYSPSIEQQQKRSSYASKGSGEQCTYFHHHTDNSQLSLSIAEPHTSNTTEIGSLRKKLTFRDKQLHALRSALNEESSFVAKSCSSLGVGASMSILPLDEQDASISHHQMVQSESLVNEELSNIVDCLHDILLLFDDDSDHHHEFREGESSPSLLLSRIKKKVESKKDECERLLRRNKLMHDKLSEFESLGIVVRGDKGAVKESSNQVLSPIDNHIRDEAMSMMTEQKLDLERENSQLNEKVRRMEDGEVSLRQQMTLLKKDILERRRRSVRSDKGIQVQDDETHFHSLLPTRENLDLRLAKQSCDQFKLKCEQLQGQCLALEDKISEMGRNRETHLLEIRKSLEEKEKNRQREIEMLRQDLIGESDKRLSKLRQDLHGRFDKQVEEIYEKNELKIQEELIKQKGEFEKEKGALLLKQLRDYEKVSGEFERDKERLRLSLKDEIDGKRAAEQELIGMEERWTVERELLNSRIMEIEMDERKKIESVTRDCRVEKESEITRLKDYYEKMLDEVRDERERETIVRNKYETKIDQLLASHQREKDELTLRNKSQLSQVTEQLKVLAMRCDEVQNQQERDKIRFEYEKEDEVNRLREENHQEVQLLVELHSREKNDRELAFASERKNLLTRIEDIGREKEELSQAYLTAQVERENLLTRFEDIGREKEELSQAYLTAQVERENLLTRIEDIGREKEDFNTLLDEGNILHEQEKNDLIEKSRSHIVLLTGRIDDLSGHCDELSKNLERQKEELYRSFLENVETQREEIESKYSSILNQKLAEIECLKCEVDRLEGDRDKFLQERLKAVSFIGPESGVAGHVGDDVEMSFEEKSRDLAQITRETRLDLQKLLTRLSSPPPPPTSVSPPPQDISSRDMEMERLTDAKNLAESQRRALQLSARELCDRVSIIWEKYVRMASDLEISKRESSLMLKKYSKLKVAYYKEATNSRRDRTRHEEDLVDRFIPDSPLPPGSYSANGLPVSDADPVPIYRDAWGFCYSESLSRDLASFERRAKVSLAAKTMQFNVLLRNHPHFLYDTAQGDSQQPHYESSRKEAFLEDKALKRGCREGFFPFESRRAVWLTLLRVKEGMVKYPQGFYQSLLKNSTIDSSLARVIQADLRRTFSNCTGFKEPRVLEILRNVLFVFAAHKPQIGYCQSLNFLCGVFIIVYGLGNADEEEVFWSLTQLVDSDDESVGLHVKGYYQQGMHQLLVDLKVLDDLLSRRCSSAKRVLTRANLDLTLLCSEWFHSLFSSCFPFPVVVRIWDCLILEGWKIVFRIAAASIKLIIAPVARELPFEQVMSYHKRFTRTFVDSERLLQVAFNELGSLSRDELSRWRNQHQRDLENKNGTGYQESPQSSPDQNKDECISADQKAVPSSVSSSSGLVPVVPISEVGVRDISIEDLNDVLALSTPSSSLIIIAPNTIPTIANPMNNGIVNTNATLIDINMVIADH